MNHIEIHLCRRNDVLFQKRDLYKDSWAKRGFAQDQIKGVILGFEKMAGESGKRGAVTNSWEKLIIMSTHSLDARVKKMKSPEKADHYMAKYGGELYEWSVTLVDLADDERKRRNDEAAVAVSRAGNI